MQDESWQMVPADKRPTPDELVNYEQQFPDDPDYSGVRRQRAIWMYDYRKETENKNSAPDDGRTLLEGHEPMTRSSASGFDEDTFSIDEVVRSVKSRGAH